VELAANLVAVLRRSCGGEPTVALAGVKNDITESESLLFGSGFGVGTDIETGPNGNLFVVSLSQGVVYEIFRR
jgi:aldose sugar dehydrogenase